MITIKEKCQHSKLKIETLHFDPNLKYNYKNDKVLNIFYAMVLYLMEVKCINFLKQIFKPRSF